jgi:hypothetical protein
MTLVPVGLSCTNPYLLSDVQVTLALTTVMNPAHCSVSHVATELLQVNDGIGATVANVTECLLLSNVLVAA